MLNNVETLTLILTVVIVFIVILLLTLIIVYFNSNRKKNSKKSESDKIEDKKKKGQTQKEKNYSIDSVMNFMEFDKVEDNMIILKDGTKYVMVIECQGVNYDLMSEIEKNSVEEGFIQFLNTIRYPIQIYVQTRTINLENSLQTYKSNVQQIEENLYKQENKYKEMISSGRYTKDQINQAYYELTKQRNLAEYGKDIIYNTEKMSLNKNVLNQKYYIIVPYYSEDLVQNDFDKEEIKNLAFSELYTRCQSLVRTLAGCEVNGKILTSNELIDLLYVAYNRDEEETYGLDKALMARYDELYSTAPDVLDKKMAELNRRIEEEAFNKANEKVIEAQSAKEKALSRRENKMEDLIAQMAQIIVEQNRTIVGSDIADSAIESIKQEQKAKKEKGGTKDNVQEKTKRRRTKTA